MVKKLFVLTVCLLCAAWETADAREIKVLQLNIWQEGTSVSGGYESLIDEIAAGFAKLENAGQLRQGNGLFDFGDFQIHI